MNTSQTQRSEKSAAYAKDRTQTPHIPDAYQTLDKEDHLFFTLYSYARSGHWLIYQSLCVWICCVKAISTKLKHHPPPHDGVIGGHFIGFLDRWNEPQHGGTRPALRGYPSCGISPARSINARATPCTTATVRSTSWAFCCKMAESSPTTLILHSAPFFAVRKQLWQNLVKRGENEFYTGSCRHSNRLFLEDFSVNHNLLQTGRPISAHLR